MGKERGRHTQKSQNNKTVQNKQKQRQTRRQTDRHIPFDSSFDPFFKVLSLTSSTMINI